MSCPNKFLPVVLDIFNPSITGDTYPEGVRIAITGQDQELHRITVTFKRDPSQIANDFLLDSETGGVILESTAAESWQFLIPEFQCSLLPADYFYHVRAEYGTDSVLSIISGIYPVKTSI